MALSNSLFRIFYRVELRYLLHLGSIFLLQNSLLSQSQRILFLGNGLTSYSLTEDFERLCEEAKYQVEVDKYTPDSYILSFHNGWLGDETSIEKINNEDWDYIILQEQSFFPLVPALRDHLTIPAIIGLKDKIERPRSCTQPILFMTWAWPKGGRFCNNIDSLGPSCSEHFRDFDDMQDALEFTYRELAQDMDLSVAPVGFAWKSALQLNPELDLFLRSTNLASDAGSYLSACVLFTTVFQNSPVGNKYISSLDKTQALFLQTIAEKTVLGHREQWRITPDDLVHRPNFNYDVNRRMVEFQDLSDNALSYLWKFGDGSTSTSRQPVHIYTNFGEYEACLSISGELGCPRVLCETLVVEEIVKFYPNPFQDELILKFQNNFDGPVKIEIFDLMGNNFIKRELSEPQNTIFSFLNFQLPEGPLILKVSSAENFVTEKIIKSK